METGFIGAETCNRRLGNYARSTQYGYEYGQLRLKKQRGNADDEWMEDGLWQVKGQGTNDNDDVET